MTAPGDRDRIPLVDDYTSGLMPDDDAEAFEAEMFQAAAAGDMQELTFLDTLRHIAPWFAERGGFPSGFTREQIEELRRGARRVHYFEIAPGDAPVTRWGEGFEYVAYRLDVDLRGCDDVVVFVSTPEGEPIKAFRDVQYDPNDGAIYGVCDEPLARRAFWSRPAVARVEATRAGKRETIATMHLQPPP